MPRRLATIQQTANHLRVSDRSIRNYISRGLFPAYRVPRVRGVLLDLDEVDQVMRRVPSKIARPGYGSFGPKAKIIDLPAQAVVVERADR